MPRLYDWLNDQQRNPKILGSRLNDEFNRIAWDNSRSAQTANYTVTTGDQGSTFELGGNTFFALTFAAASGYAANHANFIINKDSILSSGRAKKIVLTGGDTFLLQPGQSCWVFNLNSVWYDTRPPRWRPPNGSTITFQTAASGTDSTTTVDGFGTGAAAFNTPEFAFYYAVNLIDADALQSGQTAVIIQLESNRTHSANLHLATHGIVGSQGGFAFTIQGNTASIITGGVDVYFNRTLRLKDVYIRTVGLSSQWGAQVYLDNVKFQNCGVSVYNQGRVFQSGTVYFADDAVMTAAQGILCQMGGQYDTQGLAISFLNNTTWTAAFLVAQNSGSAIKIGGAITTTGTITGSIAKSDGNASINYSSIPGTFGAATSTGAGTVQTVFATPLPIAEGGTAGATAADALVNLFPAWTAYTPTITAQTGTITTASATGRWARAGRWVTAEMDITITTVGTGANGLRVTLPVTAASNSYVGGAREYAVSGKSGGAIITSGVGFGSLDTRVADGTSFIAAGAQVAVSILYEAAS